MAPKKNNNPALDLAALAVLGLDPKDIEEKVIDRIADRALQGFSCDEDGEFACDSQFKRKLDEKLKAIIDAKVGEMAEIHVMPNVSDLIDNLVLHKTSKWGEKTGEKYTFIEYLVHRADAYLQEEVDYQGHARGDSSYSSSWSKHSTRLAFMVDAHLNWAIKQAMEEAYKNANSSIVGGLKKAMEIALENIKSSLKVTTEVKSR